MAATNVFTKIAVEVAPPVARLTLTHPPLNILDLAMMDELAAALGEIEARAEVIAIVLKGSPKAFCAGVDVAAHTPDKVRPMLEKFHGVIRALVATRKRSEERRVGKECRL